MIKNDLAVLLGLSRLREYLPQLFLLFVLIYIISPQNVLSYKAAIVFLANLFLTAFTYSINDIEDAEDDYLDMKKRKRNVISNGAMKKRYGYIISFSLLFVGLALLFLLNRLVFLVGLFLSINSFLYSWKGLRLKSIPFLDIVSHAICLGLIQVMTTYLTFRPLDMQIMPFLFIIVPFSFSTQILQQLRDFEIDKKTKINNTTQSIGKRNSIILVYIFCITLTIGSTALIGSLNLSRYSIYLLLLAFFAPVIYFRIKYKLPLISYDGLRRLQILKRIRRFRSNSTRFIKK